MKPQEKLSLSGQASFNVGDTVIIYPQKKVGIVYAKTNDIGEVGVQVYRNKKRISYKKLKLHKPAAELYPEDFDFSLAFEEVFDRKVEKLIEKHKK